MPARRSAGAVELLPARELRLVALNGRGTPTCLQTKEKYEVPCNAPLSSEPNSVAVLRSKLCLSVDRLDSTLSLCYLWPVREKCNEVLILQFRLLEST